MSIQVLTFIIRWLININIVKFVRKTVGRTGPASKPPLRAVARQPRPELGTGGIYAWDHRLTLRALHRRFAWRTRDREHQLVGIGANAAKRKISRCRR